MLPCWQSPRMTWSSIVNGKITYSIVCTYCYSKDPEHSPNCPRMLKALEEIGEIRNEQYKKSTTPKEPKMQKFKLHDRVITEDGRAGIVIIPNARFDDCDDIRPRSVVQLDTGQATTWLQDKLKKELKCGDVVYIPATVVEVEGRQNTVVITSPDSDSRIDRSYIKTPEDFK